MVGRPRKFKYGSHIVTLRMGANTFENMDKIREFNPLSNNTLIAMTSLQVWVKRVYPYFPDTDALSVFVTAQFEAGQKTIERVVNLKEKLDTRIRPLKKFPLRMDILWLNRLDDMYGASHHTFNTSQQNGLATYLAIIVEESVLSTLVNLQMKEAQQNHETLVYEKGRKKNKVREQQDIDYANLDPIYKTKPEEIS